MNDWHYRSSTSKWKLRPRWKRTISQPLNGISKPPSTYGHFPRRSACTVSWYEWVVSLTLLCCEGGGVSGQGCKHLPPVLPAQPGSQKQDRIEFSARHDVRRYVVKTFGCRSSPGSESVLISCERKQQKGPSLLSQSHTTYAGLTPNDFHSPRL